jgi:hypothetical protein
MSQIPKFTPGPWRADACREDHPGIQTRVYSPEKLIAVCGNAEPWSLAKDEWDANGHLIAAAPELYAALEMVRDADEDCKRDGFPTIPDIARATIHAALAKAEGRT